MRAIEPEFTEESRHLHWAKPVQPWTAQRPAHLDIARTLLCILLLLKRRPGPSDRHSARMSIRPPHGCSQLSLMLSEVPIAQEPSKTTAEEMAIEACFQEVKTVNTWARPLMPSRCNPICQPGRSSCKLRHQHCLLLARKGPCYIMKCFAAIETRSLSYFNWVIAKEEGSKRTPSATRGPTTGLLPAISPRVWAFARRRHAV